MYYKRNIDKHLRDWADKPSRKPLLLRCARQVGKSTAVKHLWQSFKHYVEINFEKQSKNSLAEVDYVLAKSQNILPLEVKAEVQGGMKSLWEYMHQKRLHEAVRTSLENFGEFTNTDDEPLTDDTDGIRHVTVIPLYALSQL